MLNDHDLKCRSLHPLKSQQQLSSVFQMAKRRAASQDVCPLEVKSLRTDKDTRISSLDRETPTKSSTENQQEEEGTAVPGGHIHTGVMEGAALRKRR